MLARRASLLSIFAAVLVLAGCSGSSASQIQQDVQLIVNGLQAILPALSGLIPQGILDKAVVIIADIKNAAAQVISAGTAPGVVQQISAAISALSTLLAPFFPVAPAIATAVQAAIVLIDLVLQMTSPATPTNPAARAIGLSPARAREILRSAALNGVKR